MESTSALIVLDHVTSYLMSQMSSLTSTSKKCYLNSDVTNIAAIVRMSNFLRHA